MSKKPTVLMILDGYGLNKNCEHNAVCEGKTPIMDQLMSQCPFVEGQASGMFVGLPDGQMGNSEVGHMNMGAGRVVYQELTRITKSIQDGDFFRIPEFLTAVENCKKHDSALHLFGLVSDGGVHSHLTHIFGLLELAKRNGLEKVYVHCFLDGRDTPPESGKGYVEQLEAKMKEIGVGEVASVMGRYYAMDRDKRWDRVEQAYKALTRGEGKEAESATAGIQASYDDGKADEFVIPFVVKKDGKPVAVISDHDSVIFFNFRPDRAREITHAFLDDTFDGFAREKKLDLVYVCFTDYDRLISGGSRQEAAASGRDGEIRPCDIFLQRRRGRAQRRRGPDSGSLPQRGCHLRLKAGDERSHGLRQAGGGYQVRNIRCDYREFRQS